MEDNGQLVPVDLFARGHHGSTGFSVGVGIGLLGLAEANEHGLAALRASEGHRGVGLCFEITIGQNAIDLALEGSWYSLDDFWEGFSTLKKGENEGSVDVVS